MEQLSPIIDRISSKVRETGVRPEVREAEAAERHRKAELLMAEIGIPRRFFGATLETAEPTPAIARIRAFVTLDAPAGRCLVLSGPPGVGKTWATVCALKALPRMPQRFFYFSDICTRLLDGAGSERRDTLEAIQRTPLLAIDDFGVEYVKPGGLVEAFTDSLFYHREAQCLPTIITTNLLPDELKARLSQRILDRLRGEWGEAFSVPGSSLRRRPPAPPTFRVLR